MSDGGRLDAHPQTERLAWLILPDPIWRIRWKGASKSDWSATVDVVLKKYDTITRPISLGRRDEVTTILRLYTKSTLACDDRVRHYIYASTHAPAVVLSFLHTALEILYRVLACRHVFTVLVAGAPPLGTKLYDTTRAIRKQDMRLCSDMSTQPQRRFAGREALETTEGTMKIKE